MSEDNTDKLMFAMAKEFGWTPDQVLNLPYKLFLMYARELGEYYKAMDEAQSGKKHNQKLTDDEKERRRKKIEGIRNNDKSSIQENGS